MLKCAKQFSIAALIIAQFAVMLAPVQASVLKFYEPSSAPPDCDHRYTLERIDRHIGLEINKTTCTNFHARACKNANDCEKVSVSMDRMVTDNLLKLFKSDVFKGNTDPVFKKMREYYEICTDQGIEKMESRGYQPFLLPLTHNVSVLAQLAKLGRLGYEGHFLSIKVEPYTVEDDLVTIRTVENVEKIKIRSELCEMFFEDFEVRACEEAQLALPHFEENLRHIALSEEEADEAAEAAESLVTLGEVSELFGGRNFLDARLGNLTSDENHLVFKVIGPKRVKEMLRFMQEQQLNATIYTISRFIDYLESLPNNMLNKFGTTPISCIQHMRKTLPLPMNYVYRESNYADRDYSYANTILEEMHNGIINFTKEMNRGKNADQALALFGKLKAIKLRIGNMPRYSFDFEKYIEMLPLSDNFYENHLNALALSNMCVKDECYMMRQFDNIPPSQPNEERKLVPYYVRERNMIVLPYSFGQKMQYYGYYDFEAAFGGLGPMLGIEMFRAIDRENSYYDERGIRHENGVVLSNYDIFGGSYCILDDLRKERPELLDEVTLHLLGVWLAKYGLDHFRGKNAISILGRKRARDTSAPLFFWHYVQNFCGDKEMGIVANYALYGVYKFLADFRCPDACPDL